MPPSLLARLRLLTLCLAVASAIAIVPGLLDVRKAAWVQVASCLLAVMLSAYWIAGARRGKFPIAGEPLEIAGVFVLLRLAPGNPFLPLFGLLFRSLFGRPLLAFARYGLWMAALLLAHAPRGSGQLDADLARAAGVALVPGFVQMLRSSIVGLQDSERRLASLVQNSTDIVTIVDDDLHIRWQAESIHAVLGWEPSELLGTPLEELVHPNDRAALRACFSRAREQTGRSLTIAARLRHGDGNYRHVEAVMADRLHDRSVRGFVLNMRDATERLVSERERSELASRLEHDSLHDPLTGLANRRSLFASLDRAIDRADADGTRLALLLIDLDRFKELNDTLGHLVGDELLRDIRPRLLDAAGEGALVARLGGDEFAVLLHADRAAHAEETANRLLAAIERPFIWQGLRLLVEASIGIAMYPSHARNAETLLQRADIAMYAAKRNHLGHAHYEPGEDENSRDRLLLLGQLPGAIDNGQLVLHYQPKFELTTGMICGVEGLVRWQHPERGLLYPGAFLPVVEHTGLMRPLTLHILDQALAQCARWQRQGLVLPIAINLSAPNLLDAGLPDDVGRLLGHHDVPPSSLQLEITERIMAADPVRIREVLDDLCRRGIPLALDDFGTGSSSLSYVRELPVQELKIDRAFTQRASAGDQRDAAIVRTIIALARDLGLRSVAEGIETDADRLRLTSWGCDQGQGFGLARPAPADIVIRLVNAQASEREALRRAAA
jgi:diguanylate cyclase (GGDEF)-like protein/PAS domain S-box-containing protein